jgi:hypothetical protein
MSLISDQLDEACRFEEECVPYFKALLKLATTTGGVESKLISLFKLAEIEGKLFREHGYFPSAEIICLPEDSVRQRTWGGVSRSIYVR